MKPTLLVLAAGMGSRYGGVKQIDAVGLHGECLLDFSTFDAKRSGFGKVVYIIRKDIEKDFRERLFDRVAANFDAEYVFQTPDALFTDEQKKLSGIARNLYAKYQSDGKYILDGTKLVICQSNAKTEELKKAYPDAVINPLGDWTGGVNVDCGATNRKLGSDMADAVTGGGLHGKDLSKADVSVNIYAHLVAQREGKPVLYSCAIGDETVNGIPYDEIIRTAGEYIRSIGGFEKLAEWGLV